MAQLTSPEEFLGFPVGEERCLADWDQITDYFAHLSSSPRMTWEEIGATTEGNPMYLATISSPDNIENLEEIRAVQKRLADPRTWCEEEERRQLLEEARGILLLTCGLHSTEVGPSQMSMQLAYELLTEAQYESQLEDVVLLLVPCLNPDGLEIVVDWYRRTLDTPYEGTRPPVMYHKYVDHDNNRDWFMLTQKENQLIVRHVHNRWHPHIVFDQHQTEPGGPRFVLPPYIDPNNPHMDPIIQASGSAVGMHIAHSLIAQGMRGVAVNTSYAAYSPSFSYQCYHGGVRLLSETASCRLATSVDIEEESMRGRRDFEPRDRTWNNPSPWRGGRWTLPDIVRYQKAASLACLEHIAANRRLWLEGFASAQERAVAGPQDRAGYLIPVPASGSTCIEELLEVLIRGMVEIFPLREPIVVGGRTFPAGSYWIPLNQPFESYARVLLSDDPYPEVRQYPGGPLESPPNETGHNLPDLLDVECVCVSGEEEGASREERESWAKEESLSLSDVICSPTVARSQAEQDSLLLPGSKHSSFRMVNRVLSEGGSAYRLTREGKEYGQIGDFLITPASDLPVPPGLDVGSVEGKPDECWQPLRAPRVGVYRSWMPAYDEGWTRWILEQYGFTYRTLHNADIRNGDLDDIDVIILPHQNPTGKERLDRDVPPLTGEPQLTRDGLQPGTYPREYTGGLGEAGARAIHDFVHAGGVVLALGESCRYVTQELMLPVTDIVRDLDGGEFEAAATLVHVVVDAEHELGMGMNRLCTGLITGGPIYTQSGDAAVSFAPQRVLSNGFLVGEKYLRGRPAVQSIGIGDGKCILSSLRLQYRAQMRATYPVLFNALFCAQNS